MQTFLSVCRTLNYTRSAAELNITQPAVSQHIAWLEKAYGAKLLSYKGKRLALTEAGVLVRDAAARMSHDEAALRESVSALAGSRRSLTVGMTLTAGEYMVARPLASFLRAHGEVQMRVVSSDTERLLKLLRNGDVDCAFIEGIFDKSAYGWRTFRTEQLVAVCAPESPLAKAVEPVPFEGLLQEALIVREPGSGTRAVLDRALAERNLSVGAFARVTEVGSLNVIKELVRGGCGISFLYEAAVAADVADGALARVPVGGRPIAHDIAFVWLADSVFSKDYLAFFDELSGRRV